MTTIIGAKTPDEIWEKDLFGRRSEAEMLMAYIESVWDRPFVREDRRAYTIAVDAGYGEGKSFFLRRLAEHLSLNHPVAFVDAWADDIADEPLTALAATLKKALGPLIDQNQDVRDRWKLVVEKTGKVALIAAKGLLRRGAALAITGAGVVAIDELIDGTSEAVQEATNEAVKDAGKEFPDALVNTTKLANPSSLMTSRIEDFEAGATAIKELKESLEALIGVLDSVNHHAPIVIIIDELDRCRPTYSVKLMEEIKHLFDVPGLVFVFGMHGGQLGHSMAAAYGSNFDGASYLRRFINRRYTLSTPSLTPLIETLLNQCGLNANQISQFAIKFPSDRYEHPSEGEIISLYMKMYGLKARDAFGIVDIIQTCSAISNGGQLLTPYLVPLIIAYHLGNEPGELISKPAIEPNWQVVVGHNSNGNEISDHPIQFSHQLRECSKYNNRELMKHTNDGNLPSSWIMEVISNGRTSASPFLHPSRYPDLLKTVGRFRNPRLDADPKSQSDQM